MSTAEQTCGAFLDALASKAPTPGGGGASALAGALGTALCTMVGNYTVGKKKYAEVEEDVKALMERRRTSGPGCWPWWTRMPPPLNPCPGHIPSPRTTPGGERSWSSACGTRPPLPWRSSA